jgi:3-keto-disaccharide hydrolase
MRLAHGVAIVTALTSAAATVNAQQKVQQTEWPQHSMERPAPPVVDPGAGALPVPPPRDAVVLFDGTSLDKWSTDSGAPAPWTVRDGYFEVAPGKGGIRTKQGFGDVQLHVEWATPAPGEGEGQDRGNSGVFLMGRYEVQVLDSYNNRTYADGQAAAIYGQFPPLVNASRPPGVWQSYDIVFHGPRFDPAGKLVRPATMTVLHNGILVHDHVTLMGPTANQRRPPYEAHPEQLPLSLQDHGHRVRYRNIWLRELTSQPNASRS